MMAWVRTSVHGVEYAWICSVTQMSHLRQVTLKEGTHAADSTQPKCITLNFANIRDVQRQSQTKTKQRCGWHHVVSSIQPISTTGQFLHVLGPLLHSSSTKAGRRWCLFIRVDALSRFFTPRASDCCKPLSCKWVENPLVSFFFGLYTIVIVPAEEPLGSWGPVHWIGATRRWWLSCIKIFEQLVAIFCPTFTHLIQKFFFNRSGQFRVLWLTHRHVQDTTAVWAGPRRQVHSWERWLEMVWAWNETEYIRTASSLDKQMIQQNKNKLNRQCKVTEEL